VQTNGRPNILVNATAAAESGALNILRQFLSAAIRHSDAFNIYVFTSASVEEFKGQGVNLIRVKKRGAFSRLAWDYSGFKKWVRRNNILPSLIISFQNTGLNFDSRIPQLIYYHQPAPFSAEKWSFFNKEERVFWFYKVIYPYFTKVLLTPITYFVAQTGWIRNGVIRQFKVRPERVRVIRPEIHLPAGSTALSAKPQHDPAVFKIFYPAMPFINKNHIELVEALHKLVNVEKLIDRSRIRMIFTCEFDENSSFVKRIIQLGLEECFQFTGKLPHTEMPAYYRSVDLMAFPSVLETFGLPLIEAASFGLKILAADLDYATEVLPGYEGVQYVKVHSPGAWAAAIRQCYDHRERFQPYKTGQQDSWKDFFEFVDVIINENKRKAAVLQPE
jgi:glycosyltransferase involved in cell wall biosynthesis